VALRPAQVDALVAASPDPRYRAAILLGADAGLRIGEIRGLEWDCVDELRRRILVSRAIDPANNHGATKSRKSRPVPVTPRLWDALAALPRRGRSVVGRRTDGKPLGYYAMREALIGAYDRAGVPRPPKPWHCLRHTFCTEMAKAGVPVHVIKRLAGHESIETTLKYMHATERDLDQAVEALAGTFGSQTGHKNERESE
jgi:integrase